MIDVRMAQALDPVARQVFTLALRDGRCGEVFQTLIEGGSATVDMLTGELILVPADVVAQLGDGDDNTLPTMIEKLDQLRDEGGFTDEAR